jgi:hypothetical protein
MNMSCDSLLSFGEKKVLKQKEEAKEKAGK